jgi:DNA-binding HxlR family transcriptional regulator
VTGDELSAARPVKRRSTCPISSALDLLGDKWTLLVMRDLLMNEKAHYRDFLASDERIATNVLADRLARLEGAGLIERTGESPRSGRQRYVATEKGRDLLPVLLELIRWSVRHDPGSVTPPPLVAAIEDDVARTARGVREAGGVAALLAGLDPGST